MKHLIFCLFVYLFSTGYGQTYTYKVTNFSDQPKEGLPEELVVEMSVNVSSQFILLETYFLSNNKYMYSDDIKSTLIDYDQNRLYSFDEKIRILESYTLRTDTFITTDKSIQYDGYKCRIYGVKGLPNVTIYACKKISKQINPGIKYQCDEEIGGIVRIEIKRKSSKLVYQLIKNKNKAKNLAAFIKQATSFVGKTKESRSILGTSN